MHVQYVSLFPPSHVADQILQKVGFGPMLLLSCYKKVPYIGLAYYIHKVTAVCTYPATNVDKSLQRVEFGPAFLFHERKACMYDMYICSHQIM